MKTLILVRHAKSSWNDPALPDRDRPLNDRGNRDAPRMGKRLSGLGVKPGVIVSSPAARALATAQLVAGKFGYGLADIEVDERLYAAEADDLLHVIRGLGDERKSAMLVGHNPGLAELANHLSGEITRMPTCAVAVFAFDAKSWTDVGKDLLASVEFHSPRE